MIPRDGREMRRGVDFGDHCMTELSPFPDSKNQLTLCEERRRVKSLASELITSRLRKSTTMAVYMLKGLSGVWFQGKPNLEADPK